MSQLKNGGKNIFLLWNKGVYFLDKKLQGGVCSIFPIEGLFEEFKRGSSFTRIWHQNEIMKLNYV